jgi:filamentous hemagglutinin family protein
MKFRFKKISLAVALLFAGNNFLFANPTGLTVVSGSATTQQNGSQLNVTTSQSAFLNWSSFNIQRGETTTFIQPSVNSIAINQIGGASPSQIFGNLNANGTVILANANGFYFGPNSMIKVGGSFIATTAALTPDFGAGSAWTFTGMPPLASIVNYGQVEVGNGKSLFLIAENIENHGELEAPGGNVGLYAGENILVSDRPDGRGLSATMQISDGSINNFGQITADAGTIALQAKVVNQDGILQADSVQNQNGVIELVASDSLNLGADSKILARGDDSASGSTGGNVTLKSENNFSDTSGGEIITTGGVNGGNGGNIEISAPNIQSLNSAMDASAQNSFASGEFFLDPVTIILGTATANGTLDNSGTVAYSSAPNTLNLNVNAGGSFKNFSQIILQASGNIYVGNGTVNSGGVFSFTSNPGITWNLSSSTGKNSGQLTLEAGGDITFGNNSKITDANNWSVTLAAGYNFVNNTVQSLPSGVGNIYLNGGSGLTGNGTIQLSAGSINLLAAQSILLASQNNHTKSIASGSVFTTGGGGIFAYALAGNIDAGTFNGGTGTQPSDYIFGNSGYNLNSALGGIATKAGGDVTLIAGNNIDSTPVPPTKSGSWWPAASGAFGAGDVTIIAGNQINGNYMLANGKGTMLAGETVQSGQAAVLQNPVANPATYTTTLEDLETAATQTQNPNGDIGGVEIAGKASTGVTLSLIQGSWNVWATENILLKEVNNPNGTFNSGQAPQPYLYDYAADAAANFWAGNAIELAGGATINGATVGGSLTRNGNANIIYAPSLGLNAGAGGITIDRSIILAPSSEGSLQIVTRDGGDLNGAVFAGSTALTGIIMSDSGSPDYTTFAAGHAITPLHLNDSSPVTLDISGDINSFGLTVPTFAQINVVGDTYNFGFVGQNLTPPQTTSIDVGQTAKENMEKSGLLNPATDSSLHIGGNITYRGDLTSESLNDPLPPSLFNSSLSVNPETTGKLSYNAATGTLSFIGVMTAAELAFLLNPSVLVLDANGQSMLDANGNPVTKPVSLDATQQAAIKKLSADSQTASLGDQGLAISGPGKFNVTADSIDLGISGGISVFAPINVATSVLLTDPLPAALFDPAQSGDPELAGKLHYDSTTGVIIFDGVMSPAEFAFLLNPTTVALDAKGNPVTHPVALAVAQLSAINQLYADNKNDVVGADIKVTTTGDLEMTSTKIANEGYLGGINLNVGGTLDVGGQFSLFGDPNSPKGIFTTSGGNISVTAGGGVNVDSSRIAAYNGGNLGIKSVNGDVNAGTGGEGYVTLSALEIDPTTGQLTGVAATIPGSGILATTVFGSDALLGNINVDAPNGSINASRGGIIQISFNETDSQNSFIELNAGHDINAEGSGVIGSNIKLSAGGNINGLIVGSQSVNIASAQNVDVVAVSGGDVNINASGEIAGTVIGGGSVNVSGDSITASLISGSVSAAGDTSGATEGVPQSNVAKNNAETADDASTVAAKSEDQDADLKKKEKGISLATKVGRVTVILPAKALSENQNSRNPL